MQTTTVPAAAAPPASAPEEEAGGGPSVAPGGGQGWLVRVLAAAAVVASGAQLLVFLGGVAGRWGSPFPLDWIEGLSLLQALAMERGLPPYHPPQVEAIPPIYTPLLAFVLRAGLALGIRGLWVARVVSVVAILGCVALLYLLVRREGGSRVAGVAAAGVFLGTAGAVDRVYDMGRVDSLGLVLFLLGTWWITAPGRGLRRGVAGAMALVAAVYAKQSLGAPALALLAGHALRRPRRAGVAALVFAALGGVAAGLLELWCEGWFVFWTLDVPRRHELEAGKHAVALGPDLWAAMASWLLAAVPLTLLLRAGAPRRLGPGGVALPATAAACFLLGYAQRLKVGGHVNVWAPFFLMASLCVGLLLADLRRLHRDLGPEGRRVGSLLRGAVLLLVAVSCAARLEDPRRHHPGPETRARTENLRRLVREAGGPVLVPVYPAVAELMGAGPQFSLMPLWDMRYGGISRPVRGLDAAVRGRRWAAVVLPSEWGDVLPGLGHAYVDAAPLELPAMTAGNRYRGHRVWLPRDPALRPAHVDLGFDGPVFRGLRARGSAFGPGPTPGSLPYQGPIEGRIGWGLANSYHGGDAARGRLESAPFPLRGNALGILVGGGASARVRAVLEVDGEVVGEARGRDDEVLRRHLWDLRDHRGQDARLRLLDEDPEGWGHLLVDDAVLLEVPESLLEER